MRYFRCLWGHPGSISATPSGPVFVPRARFPAVENRALRSSRSQISCGRDLWSRLFMRPSWIRKFVHLVNWSKMVLECRKILVRQILNFREGRKNRLLKRFTLQSTSELNIAVVCCQNCWMLFQYGKRFFLFFILFFYILGAFLIKQLFHSRL